jgi:hypothetical protein
MDLKNRINPIYSYLSIAKGMNLSEAKLTGKVMFEGYWVASAIRTNRTHVSKPLSI